MTAAEADAADALWSFAGKLYAAPAVAERCIELQDAAAADVNLLLWCCWYGVRGRVLRAADLRAADAVVAVWRGDVVRPLRALRRRLKHGVAGIAAARSDAHRERLQQLELDAERIELAALAELSIAAASAGDVDPETAIRTNLCRYFAELELDPTRGESALQALLAGCRDLGVRNLR